MKTADFNDPVFKPYVLREMNGVTVAVIGPVCRAALAERGITPAVEPARGTMGALVHAIAERLSAG